MNKTTKSILVLLLLTLILAIPSASYAMPDSSQATGAPAPDAANSTVYVRAYFNQNYYNAKIRLLKQTYDGSFLPLYSRGPYTTSPAYATPPFYGLAPSWYKVAVTYYTKGGTAVLTQYSSAFYLNGSNTKTCTFYGP